MLSPYTTPSACNAVTNALEATALQQTRNGTMVMEQVIIQHCAGALNKEKTFITGPPAGPATGNPEATEIAVLS